MSTEGPATLAAWLRTRSDEQLSALLAARPDVARPAPSDVVALASRLAVPVSVDRALDELDAATLQVLDVVLLAPTDGLPPDELVARLPELPDEVLEAAVATLTDRALLWGDDVLRAPEPVRRAVRYPAGLGRPATEIRLALPADLPETLAELPADELAVLERLAGERPVGHLPDAPGDGAGTPARRLRSTSNCPARSGWRCAGRGRTAPPGCARTPTRCGAIPRWWTGRGPARPWRRSAGSASC
jgi:hypothetical protein